jgi:hypothetical protein
LEHSKPDSAEPNSSPQLKKAMNYHIISKLLLKMKRFEEKYFMTLRQGGGPGKLGDGGVGGGGI